MAKKKIEVTVSEQAQELAAEEVKEEVKAAPAKRTRKKAAPKEETAAVPAAEPETVSEPEPEKGPEKETGGAVQYDLKYNVRVHRTSATPAVYKIVSGTVYVWGDECTGRVPVTLSPDGAGNLADLLGWVDKKDLM